VEGFDWFRQIFEILTVGFKGLFRSEGFLREWRILWLFEIRFVTEILYFSTKWYFRLENHGTNALSSETGTIPVKSDRENILKLEILEQKCTFWQNFRTWISSRIEVPHIMRLLLSWKLQNWNCHFLKFEFSFSIRRALDPLVPLNFARFLKNPKWFKLDTPDWLANQLPSFIMGIFQVLGKRDYVWLLN